MVLHIPDRQAQARVRLGPLLGQLFGHPALKPGHHRSAVGLVVRQPLQRIQTSLLRLGVDPVDFSQLLQHMLAFAPEAFATIHKFSPAVNQAIGEHGPEFPRDVSRQRIAHQDRWL